MDGRGVGVVPTGEQGSGILRSMLLADGLAVLEPEARITAGEPVEVILLRGDLAPIALGETSSKKTSSTA
jgi:molybdopterin biosynthesis enzyme